MTVGELRSMIEPVWLQMKMLKIDTMLCKKATTNEYGDNDSDNGDDDGHRCEWLCRY